MCKRTLIACSSLVLILALCQFSLINAGRTYGGGRANGGMSNANNNNYGARRNYYGQQNPNMQQESSASQTPPQTPKEYLDNNSSFSTFGIISIIFVVILSCLVFYYGIMCYPFLCKDEKKYRFMDVSSTITTATSRSIQSIENYPVDQKH